MLNRTKPFFLKATRAGIDSLLRGTRRNFYFTATIPLRFAPGFRPLGSRMRRQFVSRERPTCVKPFRLIDWHVALGKERQGNKTQREVCYYGSHNRNR